MHIPRSAIVKAQSRIGTAVWYLYSASIPYDSSIKPISWALQSGFVNEVQCRIACDGPNKVACVQYSFAFDNLKTNPPSEPACYFAPVHNKINTAVGNAVKDIADLYSVQGITL